MSTQQVTKPFDLEAAKAGKPVCTKWGLPVRIICWDVKTETPYNLIGLVTNGGHELHPLYYRETGDCYNDREYDLRMAPEILTQWVNILEAVDSFGGIHKGDKHVCSYKSEEEAKSLNYSEHWKVVVRAKRVDIEL